MPRIMDGRTIVLEHQSQHYRTLFNQRNGFFARIEDIGYAEPDWAHDGPELLDISITNFCERECDFCYRASSTQGKHIDVDKLLPILDQCQDLHVLQIALGGGNPNQHPEFTRILKEIRIRDIVPSYTTNGHGLTDKILEVSAETCGAIGISAYPPYDNLGRIVNSVTSYSLRINLHVILSKSNLPLIMHWLSQPPRWFDKLNAIIFLNYKPINHDLSSEVIDAESLSKFFSMVKTCGVKIGFDCCSTSGILKWLDSPSYFVESCEAAKFSAFISEDLKMYPCSFMVGTNNYGDLCTRSIYDIWSNNAIFIRMRANELAETCDKCIMNKECNGGCHFLPQINLCGNRPIIK